ncbi:MAG: hypothetical protein ACOYEG_14285 [Petrimonas sp.]|jgi:hypothetical protein|nr:MAG: hypothetical protein BWZ00_00778 [Bacteroidetes bacterium ADurb.BinA174]
MELNDEQLIELYSIFLFAISEGNDTILYNFLHNSDDKLQESKSTYITQEVMKDIDKEMGITCY